MISVAEIRHSIHGRQLGTQQSLDETPVWVLMGLQLSQVLVDWDWGKHGNSGEGSRKLP